MKFVTFEAKTVLGSIQRIGILRDGIIIDLNAAYSAYLREKRGIYGWQSLSDAIVPSNMLRYIEAGEVAREATHLALDYLDEIGGSSSSDNSPKLTFEPGEVTLLAPIPRPVSIRDCSVFLDHLRAAGRTVSSEENKQPVENRPPGFEDLEEFKTMVPHYRTSTTDVIGPDAPIIWPSACQERLDYELEFAACIGKVGVNISEEDAEDFVFGYTIFNDITDRETQGKEMRLRLGPAKGKTFENSNIMGPCLVTPDEIDSTNLEMISKLNGKIMAVGNSKDMYHNFRKIISYISNGDPLYPGEFIASGTVGGGTALEHDQHLAVGDEIEMEVKGIGVLKNKIIKR